jgi:hypothetical protein
MIQSVDYLTAAFQEAYAKYEWAEFLREMVILWRRYEQNPDLDPELFVSVRAGIAEMLGMAIARKDSTIFRKFADILDALPQGNAKDIDLLTIVTGGDLTPLRFVVKARASLESDMWWDRWLKRVPRRNLTKKEVKLLAQRMWAIARLNARGELNHSSNLPPAKREKLIQAELERLPDQDWWKIFKKAGCDDLKNAPAGRPAKKKKQT